MQLNIFIKTTQPVKFYSYNDCYCYCYYLTGDQGPENLVHEFSFAFPILVLLHHQRRNRFGPELQIKLFLSISLVTCYSKKAVPVLV